MSDQVGGEVIDIDEFLDNALEEREQKFELDRDIRVAAEIDIQMADRGPLYLYVVERRKRALGAMMDLAKIDPSDSVSIAKAQTVVFEYLDACSWIFRKQERAESAESIIEDHFDEQEEQ